MTYGEILEAIQAMTRNSSNFFFFFESLALPFFKWAAHSDEFLHNPHSYDENRDE